jgi:Uma2 family endonuclease
MAAHPLPASTRYRHKKPLPPKAQLPTMYDLPSEDPEEPGLPDDFHYYQPQLLRETFCPPNYAPDQYYVGTDINLYYDPEHPLWHKRPDWFAVLGVPRLYQQKELRWSYVVWQEEVSPYLIVELLSPGTEEDDLGTQRRPVREPPGKWAVYEQILQVPYYAVYDRYDNILRLYELVGGRYREGALGEQPYGLPEVRLGLGLWQGRFQGIEGLWLRWFDAEGIPLPTYEEREKQAVQQAEQERQRAEQAQQRAEEAAKRIAALEAQLRALQTTEQKK